jgi:hypothetical protein
MLIYDAKYGNFINTVGTATMFAKTITAEVSKF